MQKKRKSPRHDTIFYLQVFSLPDRSPIARMTDISVGGVMLLSSTSFSLNQPFKAAIALPPGGISGKDELECTITPRWERTDENPELVLTGCTMEIPADYEPALNEMISRYGFSSGHTDFRRLFEEHLHNPSSEDR
ncbi:MAG: PilZ domain-containing protein [Spirochaetales bacterium]|nr:PilZ domain-containing protein [Spirochaetales bacterium]MCF7938501.1 PilZ domain-containing protein [Spirochaetales bacterium]